MSDSAGVESEERGGTNRLALNILNDRIELFKQLVLDLLVAGDLVLKVVREVLELDQRVLLGLTLNAARDESSSGLLALGLGRRVVNRLVLFTRRRRAENQSSVPSSHS